MRDSTCATAYANATKRIAPFSDWRECESDGRIQDSGFNLPIPVSGQAFPRKIGQKVRGASEINGCRNVAHTTAMSHTRSDSHAALYGISSRSLHLVRFDI